MKFHMLDQCEFIITEPSSVKVEVKNNQENVIETGISKKQRSPEN